MVVMLVSLLSPLFPLSNVVTDNIFFLSLQLLVSVSLTLCVFLELCTNWSFSLTKKQGTIASKKYGVAKKANIVAVKVLGAGGSGTMADVVQGVAWAADASAEAAELKAQGKNPKHKGSAANMSLGGGKSLALDEAVDAAVDGGLHFAVAAGNDNKDACAYSPAASKNAITVGASSIGDERAYFSNHGKCVDLFAPGLNILSIWNTRNTSTNTISGTS